MSRQDNEYRANVLVNAHTNQALTPPLRRIERQQSARWGRGAARKDQGWGWNVPGADAYAEAPVPVACPMSRKSPGNHGHYRTALYPR